MTLKELALKVVEANREGKVEDLLNNHYSPSAVSVEAMEMAPGMGREVEGLDGIRGKHAWWNDAMQMHSAKVEGPFLHGDDRFAVIYELDVTNKATGERTQGREVAIYTVADGKIVREEFYYGV